MPSGTRGTPKKDWAPRFLAALAEQHVVTEAAQLAGVPRRTVYNRRERDQEFAEAWDEIVEISTEKMEAEAYRRGVDGWVEREEFDIVDGVRVPKLVVRKFSDTLLIFMLKSRRPEKYRDHHQVQHTGADGGPVNVRVELDDQQREALGDVLRGRPATRAD